MRRVSRERVAPGPRGHWLLGNLREFRRDVLVLLRESADRHGDIVRFRLGPRVIHLLNHPDYVAHVLQKNHANFDKQTRSVAGLKSVCGESLLTGNGEFWQRQRSLLQPAFHRSHVAAFAAQMTAATASMLEQWEQHAEAGARVDVASEMMRLTYTIVGRTLLGADVGARTASIEQAMQIVLLHTFDRLKRLVDWPAFLPTPRNLRFRKALKAIDAVVYRMIEEHRRSAGADSSPADLLSLLLRARDEESGAGLSDQQLRNETITFLAAGHETTANALTWTWHLLSGHPEVERQLHEELRAVLGGKRPAIDDLPRLVYTRAVIKEAIRLYPPIWIIERRVVRDDALGGYRLPAGSSVVISPYLLHRHPQFWDRPEVFDPARFQERTPAAYIPFGAGPRFCIGSEFAMMEAQVVLAMVAQRFRLRPVPGDRVEALPGITLRARNGLWMTLHQ